MVLEIPQGWIAQRRVFGKLSAAAIEAVYVALRAVAIDGDETVEQYDAAVQQRVEIHFRSFGARAIGMTPETYKLAVAIEDVVCKMTIMTRQISPETIAWGGFLSGDVTHDERPGEKAVLEILNRVLGV